LTVIYIDWAKMEQHGDFHLFSVVRSPLPLEGSAKLAVKGTMVLNYACHILTS